MVRYRDRLCTVLGVVCAVLLLLGGGPLAAQGDSLPTFAPNPFQSVDVRVQGTGLDAQELNQVFESASSLIGSAAPLVSADGYQPFVLKTVRSSDGWALLSFASYPAAISHQAGPVHLIIPALAAGIAQQRADGTWDVAVEPQPAYYQKINLVPDELLSPSSKAIMRSVQEDGQAPTATYKRIPGLPYAVGQAWRLNDGPHNAWSSPSSLDFGTPTIDVSAQVRAAENGVVDYIGDTCVAVKRGGDGLIIWYQHIVPADINRFKLQETISLGQVIGMTTKVSGCDGDSGGHHVHITWQLGRDQYLDPEGWSLNGWVVKGNTLRKDGAIVHEGTNERVLYSRDPLTKWRGEYFNNEFFYGDPALVRDDSIINFDWFSGSPGPGVNAEHFSIRWTRKVNFSGGDYEFTISRDDGARLLIDGRQVFEKWNRAVATHTFSVNVNPGDHDLQFEVFEIDGWASAKLSWVQVQPPGNLALDRPTYATSETVKFSSERANDGNNKTRWASTSARLGEWWAVDLGSVKAFNQVRINWQASYATRYAIHWSNGPNCGNWSNYPNAKVFGVNEAGWVTHNLGNQSARCVAIELATPRVGRTSYSFWEFGVFDGDTQPLSPLPGAAEAIPAPVPTTQP